MEFKSRCNECGKEYVEDLPEGRTSSWITCECGNVFGEALLIEPFGKTFHYGIEALERRRYSSACVLFATSFEVFQKQYLMALLENHDVQTKVSRFIVYDMELTRDKYSQLARFLLHSKLRHPDVSLRNYAVHYGKIPSEEKLVELAEDVLETFRSWMIAAVKDIGPNFGRMISAWKAFERLPEASSNYERSMVDMSVTTMVLESKWNEFIENKRKL